MKNWKLSALLNTPLGIVIVVGTVVLGVELLFMVLLHEFLMVQFKFSYNAWDVIDAVTLTAVVSPVLYFLVFRKIQEKEERFQKINQQINTSTQDAIIFINEQGRVDDWNPAAQRMFQYSQEEAVGQQTHQLIVPPRYRDDLVLGFAYFEETGGSPLIGKTTEILALRKDGSEFPIELSISAVKVKGRWHAMWIIRDITERKQMETELRESEVRYRRITEGLTDYQYAVRIENGRSVETTQSPACVTVTGYTAEEFAANPHLWMQMVVPEDRELIMNHVQQILAGKDGTPIEHRISRKDGEIRWIRDTTILFKDAAGKLLSYDGVIKDITEVKRSKNEVQEMLKVASQSRRVMLGVIEDQKRAEESLRQLNEELESKVAERTAELERARREADDANRAKSAFLSTMSHEIRTPMNGVVGMVDVLAQSRLSEHQADLVKTVRESANVLLGIIDDILDFSKIEAGRMELERVPVSVADLVEGLCNSLVPVATRKGVELSLFISPDIPERVLSDDVRLRQVLYNLVGNAIKFSTGRPGKQGRVSIRVTIVDAAPLRLALRIADNGIGMAPETLNALFTPFTQAEISTTRRFGGTGLGLSICKRLVDMMQGEIAVESTLGEGTTFTVTLPFELAPEQPVRSLPDLSGLDCIVLESPEINAGDLRAYLEHAGAKVHPAADAATAVRTATQLTLPVVVILVAEHGAIPVALRTQLSAVPDIRYLLITHGRRRRSRVEGPNTVSMDGDAMRRLTLLRSVAVAAGRASPEIFHERPEEPLADEAGPPTIAEARAQGRLILIAEDDDINQKVILRQLGLLGYAAEIAANGAEALRLWREGRYALLLTDLHMPEMDGYTLTETIRSEEEGRSHRPVVALTANALRGEANRVHASGMDGYLTKPVQLHLLRATLEKWLPGTGENKAPGMQSEQSVESPAASSVDVAVLQGLVGNDKATVREFLTDYLASARHLAGEMRAAMTAGDTRHTSAIAHKLKSSSRSVGAMTLGDLCAELENSGKTGDKAAIAQGMAQFETVLAQVEAEITVLLGEQ